MLFDVSEKIVVITGGLGQIGAEFVKEFRAITPGVHVGGGATRASGIKHFIVNVYSETFKILSNCFPFH